MSSPDLGAEVPAADVAEQGTAPAVPDVAVPLEAVDADVVEQAVETGPSQRSGADDLPLEADAADAAEQAAVVELDEDEHR